MSATFSGETVLVTGGAGFIGSALVRRLVGAGARVRVLDDLSHGLRANLEGIDVELVLGDVRDPGVVGRAVTGCGLLSHHAALVSVPESLRDPVGTYERNVLGTAVVLEAARHAGVRRSVVASSCAVYGDEPSAQKREGREGLALSPYAASKRGAELVAQAQAAAFGQEVAALRYFNVYGPRQRADSPYAGVIPLFVDAIRNGRAPTIFGDGGQVRDFVFVDDVVEANVRALSSAWSFRGEAINVAAGRPVTILELLRTVGEVLGRPDIQPRFEPARAGDVRESRADLARLRQLLDFVPPTALDEGLAATIAWPAG